MARKIFFLTYPDLADILGDMDFCFENLHFLDLRDFKFLNPGSQISRNLAGPGWAWLGLGRGPWARWALGAFNTLGQQIAELIY